MEQKEIDDLKREIGKQFVLEFSKINFKGLIREVCREEIRKEAKS